jgi:hypothetical protein
VATNVDVPLNQNFIDRAFSGGSFRLDYKIIGPGYTRFVGIGCSARAA